MAARPIDIDYLINRVKLTKTADRELDGEIDALVNNVNEQYPPRYTSSFDAVLWLISEILPGWKWSCTNWSSDGFESRARLFCFKFDSKWSKASTPELALLLATLIAYQNRKEL